MTSYVFSVIDKTIIWAKVHKILTDKFEDDFEMIFAISKDNPELSDLQKLQKQKKNVHVLTFEPQTSENQMLSTAIKQTKGDHMVLCRDYFEYATVMSDVLVAMGAMNVQVAMYRKPQKNGKIKAFFKKIYNKLVQLIFGFDLYEGDVGLQYFGNIPLSVLRTLPNNILFTKINKWKGFDISYVEADHLQPKKFDHHEKPKISRNLFIASGVFGLLLGGFITLCVLKLVSFLGGLLSVVLLLLVAFYIVYLSLKLSIVHQFGDLT